MNAVFLSYAREDTERALALVAVLEQKGWPVHWDRRIPTGKTWEEVVGAQLKDSGCMVVAWSKVSAERKTVLEEASNGRERGILVPVLFEDMTLPFGFGFIPTLDFKGWRGEPDALAVEHLLEAIEVKIGKPVPPSIIERPKPAPSTPSAPEPVGAGEEPFAIVRHLMKNGSFAPDLVRIPAGVFRMGDIAGGGEASEQPVHEVRIVRPFYLACQLVSLEDYDVFAKARGLKSPDDMGWGRRQKPAINVSWEDAVAYCGWLSEQTGRTYRLPSEAEWEYAARAGRDTAYWWGDEAGLGRANFDGSSSRWGMETALIGSFPPNPWKLYDTSGNVWEWVQDRWHEDYVGAPDDGSAWEAGASPMRVLRGGSWFAGPRQARCSSRLDFHHAARYFDVGFRVACDA